MNKFMSIKPWFIPFAAALILCSGKYSFAQSQMPAYDFLNVDPSARASALGGAFDTYTDDPNAMFYNPATLSTITKKKVSAGFGKYLLDINFGAVSYAQQYKNIGWFGIGVKYFDYGTFNYTDENGVTNGTTFGANDLMLSAAYSNLLYNTVNYGVTLKYIHSKIANYSSSAMAVDIGLMYLIPSEGLNVALSVNNLGSQLSSYISTKENLPLNVRVGVSKKLEHLPLKINVSFEKLNEDNGTLLRRFKDFSLGGELAFSDNISVRLGYSNKERQDLKLGTTLGIAGFSAGLGIRFLDKYQIDYSLNSMGKVGSTHRFNVGYTFNK
jgi:hypothetical protein